MFRRSKAAHLDPRLLPARLRSAARVLEFWSRGGVRIARPLNRPKDAPAQVMLTLQPDGDVILRVPPSFGQAATDKAVLGQLLAEAGTIQSGLGGLGEGLEQLMDYGVIAGLVTALVVAPRHLAGGLATSVVLIVLRTWAKPWVVRLAARSLRTMVRDRLGVPRVPALAAPPPVG